MPLAAALPLAAGAMQGAGAIMGGLGARAQAKHEAATFRQNAKLAAEGARDSISRGLDERRDFWREASAIKGSQIASMAANGIELDFGTALRLQEDTAAALSEDAGDLYDNIYQRTRALDIEVSNSLSAARAAKARGKSAFKQSLFSAGASLLGGATQAKTLSEKIKPAGTSYAGKG